MSDAVVDQSGQTPGGSRVAVIAGLLSGIVGTALFQLVPAFGTSNRMIEILSIILPVGLTFGLTMAWLGRRPVSYTHLRAHET